VLQYVQQSISGVVFYCGNRRTSKGSDLVRVSLLYVLLIIPIVGIFLISTIHSFYPVANKLSSVEDARQQKTYLYFSEGDVSNIDNKDSFFDVSYYKKIAFITTILNLIVSLIIYMLFDFSNNQFQFIQENLDLSFYDIYLGVDGVSIYFVLLTTIIMPIALVSN
jgi:NADH-ubiquinone oxidoreductase chain 4